MTAIELTSSAVKLIVGYELDGRAVVLDSLTMPMNDGAVFNGEVVDPGAASAAISKLLKQASNDLNFPITEVSLAVPPIGLEVYVVDKNQTCVGTTPKISKTDIQNVIGQVRNENVGEQNEIIGLVPECFVIDQGRAFSNPPINEESKNITLHAKIHVLPKKVIDGYRKAAEFAHVRVRKMVVAPYAAAEVVKGYKEMPSDYVLFDFGARFSTISLIGDFQLYGSTYLHKGSDHLTETLASGLKISYNEATKLKEIYGIDHSPSSYKGVIAGLVDENGKTLNYTVDNVNAVLEKAVSDYAEDVHRCINDLLSGYDESFRNLPVVVTGGGARLSGLAPILEQYLAPHPVIFFSSKAMGARNSAYTNVLGVIKIVNKYRNAFDEEKRMVTPVERVQTSTPKEKKKGYDAFEDEL
mgnify:CR=1 FL=1